MSCWLMKRNLFKRFYKSASRLHAYFSSFPKNEENLTLAERLLDCNNALRTQYPKSGTTLEFQTWWRVYHWKVCETFHCVPQKYAKRRGNSSGTCKGVRRVTIRCTWQAAPWRKALMDKLPLIAFTCICLVALYVLRYYLLPTLGGGGQ